MGQCCLAKETLQESTSECSNYENELPKLETAEKDDTRARRANAAQPKQLCRPSSTENRNRKGTEFEKCEMASIDQLSETELATNPSPAHQPGVGGGRRSTPTSPVQKGQEFERAFEETVRPLELKCSVSFKEKIHVILGEGNNKRSCTVDALFRNEKKAAVVDLKNYTSRSYVTGDHINKLAREMAIVKEKYKCTKVWGYIYTNSTNVRPRQKNHAEKKGITILRETEKTADMFVRDIDKQLLTE